MPDRGAGVGRLWNRVRMSRTQYFTATSIDGFIADSDNSLDWLFEASSAGRGEDTFGSFFAEVGAMAMGATTYEWVLRHEHVLDVPHKWRDWYGPVPCWVFTHRDLPVIPGAEITFARGEVARVHADMAAAARDKNVWLVGGGELVGQFVDQGLLDEMHLQVAPVTLCAGAPLLPRRLQASDLMLASVERNGQFVHLVYHVTDPEPAGEP